MGRGRKHRRFVCVEVVQELEAKRRTQVNELEQQLLAREKEISALEAELREVALAQQTHVRIASFGS